ncbi:MAG: bifunctional phosphopantothenoylcysteine decarboxylase/phosphopantothenate--cysteine ligase CoaBC [Acidimicrobiia bacterium]
MIRGRRVVLGVSGGVAAYKAAYLTRRLLEAGAEVKVVMTPASRRFIGSQTFASLTGEHPLTELWDADLASPHTDLAHWADLVLVAPCTANTLSKLAAGAAGDVLTTTVLATRALVAVAPAMHTEMWEHPATAANVATLVERGVTIVGPASGGLAGGDQGAGRMVEPDDIVVAVDRLFGGRLDGRRVLVSAGGTREAIDPVRYVGNRSSGKMGHAIAAAAASHGAEVVLVTTQPGTAPAGLEVVAVESAAEMADAVWSRVGGVDVAVLAAAVADYRPTEPADHKLKRSDGPPTVSFEATPDILAGVVAATDRPQVVVGFAAEVGSLERATEKAAGKGVDLLVGNDVARPGSGFGTDTNEVVLVGADGIAETWPLLPKTEVAERLVEHIADRLTD